MSKIKIKNFGPIKEGMLDNDGWIDIKKVTVFIGNQGSGKSTVAKVFSTLTWMEKALNRGDIGNPTYDDFYRFFKYQGIQNYFRNDTIIEYEGDSVLINYNKKMSWPGIEKTKGNYYNVPKIMYVPAERNFLSVIKNAYGIKNLPDTLYSFAEELRKGQFDLHGKLLRLPISELQYKYDESKDISYVVGGNFELDLAESSSGFQSFVPLYLVTKFLTDELQKGKNVLREQLSVEQSIRRNKEITDVMFDKNLTESEKSKKVEEIDSKYLNICFINIVEEPEQNLFPTSQQQMLNSLLEFNNMNDGNKLIMTTHSPYLINYLTLNVKAENVYKSLIEKNYKLGDPETTQLNEIVPLSSSIKSADLVIYELEESNGSIKKLSTFEGIPSDKNFLNNSLGKTNLLYDSLLEIEEEL